MNPGIPVADLAPGAPVAPGQGRLDVRWVLPVVVVGGLIAIGVVFSRFTLVALYPMSFSARASVPYCIAAAVIMLFMGWRNFPLAATLFYGFLPLCMAASGTYFIVGDVTSALTIEELFAIPLLIVAWLGPRGTPPGAARPMPPLLQFSFAAIVCTALLSTLLAISPGTAVGTLFGRYIIPVLVTLGVYRRLRDVSECRIIWYGFVIGFIAIAAFGYERSVLEEGIAPGVGQRHIGLTKTTAEPAVMLIGSALWLAFAKARGTGLARGVFWLGLATAIGVLLWIGSHRGPVFFAALLVLWWLPRNVVGRMYELRVLLLSVAVTAVAFWIVTFSLGQTYLDMRLPIERFIELREHGLEGEARWMIWQWALSRWESSPIWGVGLNNWVLLEAGASAHGALVGFLVDTGILGFAAYMGFFTGVLLISRRRYYSYLAPADKSFYLGLRAGWVMMLALLAVDLPLTSGQPQSNAYNYLAFFFPLVAMLVYSRCPMASPAAPTLPAGIPADLTPIGRGSPPSALG
jgi:hypothetical protein